ncbi:MAG: N-acetylmuramoyl-L-alanine amidase [Verrucomicrobiota bacterium]
MSKLKLFPGLCLAALLATVAPPALRAAAPFQLAAAPSRVVVEGVTYVDAAAFFGRHGLKGKWLEPQRRQAFSSTWTRVEIEADQREICLNGLRVFLGEATVLRGRSLYLPQIDADRLLAPILRPAGIGDAPRLRTIVIDAGHGGRDSGTLNAKLKLQEKTYTLDVARRLAALLGHGEWRVVLTRDDDRFIELGERAAQATAARADLFISIHFNAVAQGAAVKGTETYILTPRHQRSTSSAKRSPSDDEDQPGNAHDPWNAVLGYQVHRHLLEKLGTADRGLKRARFAVLRLATCPAVLVEAGYLSNDDEARKIATERYRADIAEAVANAVKAYAAALATVRR